MLVVAFGDYSTGHEVAFSFFYVIPILLISWVASVTTAIVAVVVASAAFPATDYISGEMNGLWLPLWNFLIRSGTLTTVVALTRGLRAALHHERDLARTDPLTGVSNSRSFFELADTERARARRNKAPMTLIYMDLDDFKIVNDEHGHQAGDELLEAVAGILSTGRRATDVVGRLGGDEFALVLPETDEAGAAVVVDRLRSEIRAVAEGRSYSVTTSVGVTVFRSVPDSLEDMIWLADQLMYSAKRAGKDQLRLKVVKDVPSISVRETSTFDSNEVPTSR
jgi:diguanylate cyclase (GGDEF)-like protein